MFDNRDNETNANKKEKINDNFAKIKVIGVGGGGCNAINTMIKNGVSGVEFWAMNTDAQALEGSECQNKLVLGNNITRGLGAGADPKVGLSAAIESENEVKKILKDTDMLFIAAGMGGGTGTGGVPVIAKIAHDMGILTVGVVTKPFSFEGPNRSRNALEGLSEFRKYVDSYIVISNDRLLELVGDIPFQQSFNEADKILMQSVQTITDLIAIPASINLDFADIKNTMTEKGVAVIGIGMAKGDSRPEDAAERAVACPIIDVSIAGASTAIVNVTSANATLNEVSRAINVVKNKCKNNINIIYGMAENKQLDDDFVVSIIATGFDKDQEPDFEENNSDSLDEKDGNVNNYYENTSDNILNNKTEEQTNELESVYESKSFTEQLNLQKQNIISSRETSREKIITDKASGKRSEFEENVKKRLDRKKRISDSIIPSFLKRRR